MEKLPPTKKVRAEPGLFTTPLVLLKSPAEVQSLLKVVELPPEANVLLIATDPQVTVPQVRVGSLFVPSIVKAILLGKRFPELFRFPSTLIVVKLAAVRLPPARVKWPSAPLFIF